jgi:predicted transcriptional regulator
MKTEKPNAELVWKQLEDLPALRLRLSVFDHTVYSHLLRHSRLEGKLRFRFSILGLGRNIRLSTHTVRKSVRRLVSHGCASSNAAKPATSSRCACPRRFALRS